MLLKYIISVITLVMFTDICVFFFSNLVSNDPQKWSLMWYTSKHCQCHCHSEQKCLFFLWRMCVRVSSMIFQSVMFLLVAILLNALQHNLTHSRLKRLHCLACQHVVALTGNEFNCCWVEDRHKHEPTVQNSHKEILTAEWRTIASGPTLQCLYAYLSSPTDCMWTHWPQHPAKPLLPQNVNITIRLKPKQRLRKYIDMYSQLQIWLHRVSTYSRSYLKRINLENEIWSETWTK